MNKLAFFLFVLLFFLITLNQLRAQDLPITDDSLLSTGMPEALPFLQYNDETGQIIVRFDFVETIGGWQTAQFQIYELIDGQPRLLVLESIEVAPYGTGFFDWAVPPNNNNIVIHYTLGKNEPLNSITIPPHIKPIDIGIVVPPAEPIPAAPTELITPTARLEIMTEPPYYPGSTLQVQIISTAESGRFQITDWNIDLTFSGGVFYNHEYWRVFSFNIPDDVPTGNYPWTISTSDKPKTKGDLPVDSKGYCSCCTRNGKINTLPGDCQPDPCPAGFGYIITGPCSVPTLPEEPTPTPIPIVSTPTTTTPESGTPTPPVPVPLSGCIGCPTACAKPTKPEWPETVDKRTTPGKMEPGTRRETTVCGPGSSRTGGLASSSSLPSAISPGRGLISVSGGAVGWLIESIFSALEIPAESKLMQINTLAFLNPVYQSSISENQAQANEDCPQDDVCVLGQCLIQCGQTHLLITEIGKNFIEIYNPLPKSIELDDYELQGFPFPAGAVIESQGYLVISNLEEGGYDYYFPEMELDDQAGTVILSYQDKLVDYVRYGETSPIVYEEGDTLPVFQRFIPTNPEEFYKELIISEVVADFALWVYYVEITNVGENTISLEDLAIRFYANDDYFEGRFPYYKIAVGESVVVKFESLFAEEDEPILLEGFISFDDFTERTQTNLLGFMPALEITLYRVINEEAAAKEDCSEPPEGLICFEGWDALACRCQGEPEPEKTTGDLEVLDYFIKDLPELKAEGRSVYQTAVQKTFQTSIISFRPNDFVQVQEPSLGQLEYFDEIDLAELLSEEPEQAGLTDTSPKSSLPEVQGQLALVGAAVVENTDTETLEPKNEPEPEEPAVLSIEEYFARPCLKIQKQPGHEFYEACQAAQTAGAFGLTEDAGITLQRVIFDEEEKEGGRGLDSKDPTSEKVNEHWDWLKATPGSGP